MFQNADVPKVPQKCRCAKRCPKEIQNTWSLLNSRDMQTKETHVTGTKVIFSPSPQKRSLEKTFPSSPEPPLSNPRRPLEKHTAVSCQIVDDPSTIILKFMKTIKWMKPGRASSSDNVPLEFFIHREYNLFYLMLLMWDTEIIQDDFKNANIITIFKEGNQSACNNYCGMSLLCIVSKSFVWILLDHLLDVAKGVLSVQLLVVMWNNWHDLLCKTTPGTSILLQL